MRMHQIVLKKKAMVKDESGSVLLFSISILFLLVVITTTIGLVVVNRANIVKASAEKSSLLTRSNQYFMSSENALSEIIFQNDEIARYYMGMKYYEKSNTNFNTSVVYGGDPRLDAYLRSLIDSSFQASVKSNYNTVGYEMTLETMYAYISIRRGERDLSGATPPLLSVKKALENTRTVDGIYNVTDIDISTKYGESGVANQKNPKDFLLLYEHVRTDKEIVNFRFKGVHDTHLESKSLANVTGNIVIAIYPLDYLVSGTTITTPTFDDISTKSIKVKEYRITQIGK